MKQWMIGIFLAVSMFTLSGCGLTTGCNSGCGASSCCHTSYYLQQE